MSDINEVRERLHTEANAYAGGQVFAQCRAEDVNALLDDHARLAEELRKVNSGETASVRFDLSPAAKECAVRDQLVAMGWTPPGVAPTIDLEQLRELLSLWKKSEYPLSYEGTHSQRALNACIADLQALIDGQGKEPAAHYHCAEGIQGTVKRLRRYAKLNKTNLMGQTMEEAAAYINAMQPTKGEGE